MPVLVIKALPVDLHRNLKESATRNHRSMTQQAIVLLEQGLHQARPVPPVKAYRGKFPLTDDFINAAKREGRR